MDRYDRVAEEFVEWLNEALYRYRVEVLLLGALAGVVFLSLRWPSDWWTWVAWGALFGLLAARPSRRWLRGVLRRARWERRWEARVAPDLGWKSHGRVPELLGWDTSRDRVSVSLRPLPEQGPQSWPLMADALRRHVHGSSVQWKEAHGVLSVMVALDALPERLEWKSGSSTPTSIVIGQRHGGADLSLDVARTPHVLLAGATGSGKGGTIRAACASALEMGWQVVVCDPKHSGEYRWLEELGVPVLRTPREQLSALERLEAIRHLRQQVVREHGVDHWLHLPEDLRPGWRFVLIVLDEAADMLMADRGMSDAERDVRRKLGGVTVSLARKARTAGGHLLVAIQRPDVAQLGEHGGSLRNNLVARLALGRLDSDGVRMLGVSASEPVLQVLDGTPGRGVCVGFAGDPRPSACQVSWLEQAEAWAAVRAAAEQGFDAIEPAGARLEVISA